MTTAAPVEPEPQPEPAAIAGGGVALATAPAFRVWTPAARSPVVTAVEAAGIVVVDDPVDAVYAVVSTRHVRHRISEYIGHAQEIGLPVIVLVHPGGESLAVDALRSGGQVAIAEGDADALRALYETAEPGDERIDSLLDAYEARLGRSQAASKINVTLFDPVSGLPASGALAARLASGYDPTQNLRMVAISVSGLADPVRLRLGNEAQMLLHRRIAMGVRLLCQPFGDLYDIGDGTFLLLAAQFTSRAADQLGADLAEVVDGYMPDGHLPLTVAIGHAGPECSTDLPTLRELAGRAETAARLEERSVVLGAGELVRPLATATELEVTLRLAEVAAERDGASPRQEIAAVANDIAVRLGFEGRERLMVRFCAEVADIGSVLAGTNDDRAASAGKVLTAAAGPTVAAALRALGEHWDGSGAPDGLSGASIPVAARIVVVADALVTAGYALDDLVAGAGTRFDPTVVSAAGELVRQR